MIFSGFSKETAAFLFALQYNNTFELLPENKVKYKELVTEPLTLLYEALLPAAKTVSPTVDSKASRCVSSMYNDMRFSKGAPLKTYMYLRFKETGREKDVLGLYFDMGYDYYSYGLRIYKQTSAGMERIRTDALNRMGEYSRVLAKTEDSDIKLVGDNYTKDHFPGVTNAAVKTLLNKKAFYLCRERPVADAVIGDSMAADIADGFYALRDMYVLLKDALLKDEHL